MLYKVVQLWSPRIKPLSRHSFIENEVHGLFRHWRTQLVEFSTSYGHAWFLFHDLFSSSYFNIQSYFLTEKPQKYLANDLLPFKLELNC